LIPRSIYPYRGFHPRAIYHRGFDPRVIDPRAIDPRDIVPFRGICP